MIEMFKKFCQVLKDIFKELHQLLKGTPICFFIWLGLAAAGTDIFFIFLARNGWMPYQISNAWLGGIISDHLPYLTIGALMCSIFYLNALHVIFGKSFRGTSYLVKRLVEFCAVSIVVLITYGIPSLFFSMFWGEVNLAKVSSLIGMCFVLCIYPIALLLTHNTPATHYRQKEKVVAFLLTIGLTLFLIFGLPYLDNQARKGKVTLTIDGKIYSTIMTKYPNLEFDTALKSMIDCND